MSLLEDIKSNFEALNVPVNAQVLQKCVELCNAYNIDPEDFLDQWLAYTASNLHGEPPTLDALDRMERRELKKQTKPTVTLTPQSYRKNVESTPIRTPVRQNLQKEMQTESPKVMIERMEGLEEYISHTVPSQSFANRADSGSVINEFGESNSTGFKERCSEALSIKIQNEMPPSTNYMYEKFLSKRAALDSMSKQVISDILEEKNLRPTQEKLKQYSGEMVICGRICSESNEKFDLSSVMLQGLVDLYRGHVIKISTNKLDRVRLFSGQSVVVVGNNMKDWFTAKDIFTDSKIPPSPDIYNSKETLQVVTAMGPFTLQENLLYEPLDHLLKHVEQNKPNLLILMGPFMDADHSHHESLCETYDAFFENLIDGIMQRLKGTGVQVVLVPSHKDIHHTVIFPCLPFKLKKRHENLYLAPNPFILNINGLTIGGSTADALFHLSKHESAKGAYEDRIGHIISHVFAQRSFYPLHPPDADLNIDYQLLQKYGMLHEAPHIMILPSNLKHFIRTGVKSVADDCLIVNPERLTKGNIAGTFAKIEVRSEPTEANLLQRLSCIIQRI